jgi:exopolysaccharide production protein ExoQ
MSSSLALFAWLVLLLALLRLDPARYAKTSAAMWVPVAWIFIAGSRLPSQWLSGAVGGQSIQALEEGNPLDRAVYVVLILLAIGILASRAFKWSSFFANNQALSAFVFFGFVSVFWSDYPFVTFKHWFRDLGNYLVILVALSDPRPLDAITMVVRRVCYLLIPLSIVLVKYFPQMGKQYEEWSGAVMYTGAATSKNMLGVMCLVGGIFFLWDLLGRWPGRRQRGVKQIIAVDVVFLAMSVWLLIIANSATSRVCLLLGWLVIVAARSKMFRRHPALLKRLVPAFIVLSVIFYFAFNINAQLVAAVGRDATFTGRTDIWKAVLSVHTNFLVGAGYESFWLGPRVTQVWNQTGAGINEAHNGYLEIYLNLGLAGLFLLIAFLIASYRSICRALQSPQSLGSFSLAIWTILLFYNITESAFKGQLMWVLFLSGAIVAPGVRAVAGRKRAALEHAGANAREAMAPAALDQSAWRSKLKTN